MKNKLTIIISMFILIVVFLNLLSLNDSKNIISDMLEKYNELNRPANLDVMIIRDDKCVYCYDPEGLIGEISTEGVYIRSKRQIDYRHEEAKELVLKYKIEKVPAIIIGGEINKTENLSNKLKAAGDVVNGTFVFKSPGMPYVDTQTGKTIGSVKIILMSANDCSECYNYEKYIAELKILGIPTSNRETIDYMSGAGKTMVSEKSIERVPTFILLGDLDQYPTLKKIQDYENDVFVLRDVIGPYFNIREGRLYNDPHQ